MTRKELHDKMKAEGFWHVAQKQNFPLWVQALELYKRETGDHEVNLSCGGCVNKIKNWLER